MVAWSGIFTYNSQAVDGDKFICLDAFNSQDCLVYSFGIRYKSLVFPASVISVYTFAL